MVSWDGGGSDTNWFNSLNWSNDLVPTVADNVTIITATNGVDINTGGTAAAFAARTVRVTCGSQAARFNSAATRLLADRSRWAARCNCRPAIST